MLDKRKSKILNYEYYKPSRTNAISHNKYKKDVNIRVDASNKILRHQQKKKQRQIRFRIFLSILALSALIYILFFSKLFAIKNIHILGNSKISNEEIISKISDPEANFFMFNPEKASLQISEIPSIGSTIIAKKFPNTIKITVTEAVPLFSIAHNNQELLLDENLKIIQIRPITPNSGIMLQTIAKKPENVVVEDTKHATDKDKLNKSTLEHIQEFAVIEGLILHNIKEGQKLESCFDVANTQQEQINSIRACINKFKEFNLLESLERLNIENPNSIIITLKNKSILKIGDAKEIDQKIGCYLRILEKLDKDVKVELDLSIPGKCFLK